MIDRYGCREASTIAQECVAGVIHVCHDWLHVEIVDDAGQPVPEGEPGQVVVTSLFNLGMPLLRYTVDDVARWRTAQQPCACGNPFPALECIEGRVSGLVVLPGGGYRVNAFFATPLRLAGALQFQVLQPDATSLMIKYIPGPKMTADSLDLLKKRMAKGMPGLQVQYVAVDSIPLTPSGKHRAVISAISNASVFSKNPAICDND